MLKEYYDCLEKASKIAEEKYHEEMEIAQKDLVLERNRITNLELKLKKADDVMSEDFRKNSNLLYDAYNRLDALNRKIQHIHEKENQYANNAMEMLQQGIEVQ